MQFHSSVFIAILATILISLGCKEPTKTYVYESKDTFEAFGRRKPTVSTPLFLLTDEARKNIPKEKLKLFIRAQSDIDLVLSGQQPLYCDPAMHVMDGGTTIYSNADYVITHWREIREIDGVRCTRKGISIKFNSKYLGMNRPFDDVSQTWIEFWPNQP